MGAVNGTTLTAYTMTGVLADRDVERLLAAIAGDTGAEVPGDVQLSGDGAGPFWAAAKEITMDLDRLAEVVRTRRGEGVAVSQCGDAIHITCGKYTEKPWLDWDEKVLFWSPAPVGWSGSMRGAGDRPPDNDGGSQPG